MWPEQQRKFYAPRPKVWLDELTCDRRMLAVGLESGEILIYASHQDTPSQWTNVLTIGTQYVSLQVVA